MHTCVTYFYVDTTKSANFDVQSFLNNLDICTKTVHILDNGCIKIGKNTNYNVDLNVMIRHTLAEVLGKQTLLASLAKQYNLTYYLVRVPHVYANSDLPKPLLSLDSDVVAFLHNTGTIDDIDYYVY